MTKIDLKDGALSCGAMTPFFFGYKTKGKIIVMKTIAGFSKRSCQYCGYSQMDEIAKRFADAGAEVYREIIVGSLCEGLTILTGWEGHWSFVFCEEPRTEWTSDMAYRRFKVLPKKYRDVIEAYENDCPYEMSVEDRHKWEQKIIKKLCA